VTLLLGTLAVVTALLGILVAVVLVRLIEHRRRLRDLERRLDAMVARSPPQQAEVGPTVAAIERVVEARPPVAPPAADSDAAAEDTDSVPPPRSRVPGVDWERWLGIRGAAVAGGITLALASILFFRYSIEHGLITPAMRLGLGSVLGFGGLLGSSPLLHRGYATVANALAAAGAVALYAVAWAAHARYGFVSAPVAFGAMALVTALVCLLALRRAAPTVAAIALIGGFATPLLVSSTADEPIGLFGYLLLLDGALLFLARRQAWPLLPAISLLLTGGYQVFWIGTRMHADQLGLGLAILVAFAAVFAAAARPLALRAAALLLPFAFAVHLTLRADLGPHLWPVAAVMLVLQAAAAWLGRQSRRHEVGAAAAAAALGVVAVWYGRRAPDPSLAWEGIACMVAFAVPPALLRQPGVVLVSALGGLAVTVEGSVLMRGGEPWPWWAGALVLGTAVWACAGARGRSWAHVAAAALVAAVLGLHDLVHVEAGVPPWLGRVVHLVFAAVALAAAWRRRDPGVRRAALTAAWLLAWLLVRPLLQPSASHDVWWRLGAGVSLATVAALAATALRHGGAFFVAALCAAAVPVFALEPGWKATWPLVAIAAAFTWWPVVAHRAFAASRGGFRAAALVPLVFLPALSLRVRDAWGVHATELLAALLGAILAGAALGAARLWQPGDRVRTSALAWLLGMALAFLTAAVPHPVAAPYDWIPWSVTLALGLACLWRRVDHFGLKLTCVTLALLATASLCLHPVVLDHVSRPRSPWWNELVYLHAVAGPGLLAAAVVLGRPERARLRRFEPRPWAGMLCGIAAVLVGFVWINVQIALVFAEGDAVSVSFARHPSRDLAASVAWTAYALGLLLVGVAGRIAPARWLSLVLMLLNAGKVFLHDLGELEDLHRVASLAGLAVSLLAISLLYQRFVFRRPTAGAA